MSDSLTMHTTDLLSRMGEEPGFTTTITLYDERNRAVAGKHTTHGPTVSDEVRFSDTTWANFPISNLVNSGIGASFADVKIDDVPFDTPRGTSYYYTYEGTPLSELSRMIHMSFSKPGYPIDHELPYGMQIAALFKHLHPKPCFYALRSMVPELIVDTTSLCYMMPSDVPNIDHIRTCYTHFYKPPAGSTYTEQVRAVRNMLRAGHLPMFDSIDWKVLDDLIDKFDIDDLAVRPTITHLVSRRPMSFSEPTVVFVSISSLFIFRLALSLVDFPDVPAWFLDDNPLARPVPVSCLTNRHRRWIDDMEFYHATTASGECYLVDPDGPGDYFCPTTTWSDIPDIMYSSILFLNRNRALIFPWGYKFIRTAKTPRVDRRVFGPTWPYKGLYLWLFFAFSLLPPTDAVTTGAGEAAAGATWYGILLLLLVQTIFMVFPGMRDKFFPPPPTDDVPDLERATYSAYKTVKKAEDGHAVEVTSKTTSHSLVKARMAASIVYNTTLNKRAAKSTSVTSHDRQLVRDILLTDEDYKRKFFTAVTVRTLSPAWIPDDYLSEATLFIQKNIKLRWDADDHRKWNSVVRTKIQGLELAMPTLTFSNSARNFLPASAGHPLYDILALGVKMALGTWPADLTNTKGIASLAIDVTMVLAKVYCYMPKSRIAWLKMITSRMLPGISWQDDGKVQETPQPWMAELSNFTSWSTAREATKDIILRLMAFAATLPSVWDAMYSEGAWWEKITTFVSKNRDRKSVTVVVDSMFDLFEQTTIMCGLGRNSAMFDSLLRPAEISFSDAMDLCDKVTAGLSKETLHECERKLQAALSAYQLIRVRHENLSIYQRRHITDRIMALDARITQIMSRIDGGEKHYATYFIGLTGAPGIGKSTAIDCLLSFCLKAIGEDVRKGDIVETDKYDSGLDPYQNALVYDDVGKTAEGYLEKPAGEIVIRFATNAASPLLSAIAERKGVMYSHHKLGLLTGNKVGMGLSRGMTDWTAVHRRVDEYWCELDLDKSECMGYTWRPKPEYSTLVPEPTNLTFQQVYFIPGDASSGANLKKSEVKMTWEEAKQVIIDKFVSHHRRQIDMIANSASRSVCLHGNYEANCRKCQRTLQDGYITGLCKGKLRKARPFLFDSAFRYMVEMDEDEMDEAIFSNALALVALLIPFFVNLFFIGTYIPMLVTLLTAIRCSIAIALLLEADRVRGQQAVTVDSVQHMPRESCFNQQLVGGLTIAAILAIAKLARPARKGQDGEVMEQAPKARVEFVDEAPAELAANPVVRDFVDYRNGKKETMSPSELKAFKAAAHLLPDVLTNYWCKPTRAVKVSKSGVGSTNDQLGHLVLLQMYCYYEDVVRNGKPFVIKRQCLNLLADYVLINKHSFWNLTDGSMYRFIKGDWEKRIRLDKSSCILGPEGTDWVLWYTGLLSGRCKNLMSYMTNTFHPTSTIAGRLVYSDQRSSDFRQKAINLCIEPTKSDTIECDGRDTVLKGVASSALDMASWPGLCGAIYIANRTIVAMHSYGESGVETLFETGGTLLNLDHFQAALPIGSVPEYEGPRLEYHSARVNETEPHPKNPSNFQTVNACEVWAHVERTATPRTEYVENPNVARYEALLGMPLQGKYVAPRSNFNRTANKVLMGTNANRGNPPKSLLDKAVTQYLSGADKAISAALANSPSLLRRPLTLHEALNGVPGHPYAKGVDVSKSAGYPWCTSKINLLDGEPGNYRLKPAVQRDYDCIMLDVAAGRVTGLPANVFLKDEPLPPGKDQRAVFSVNLIFQLIVVQYLGPVMHIMQESASFFGNVVGVDPGSSEWEKHESRFDKCDPDRFISADIVWYDLSHPEELKAACGAVTDFITARLEYTSSENLIARRLTHEMEHMYTNFSGPITFQTGLWPSGIPPTAIFGAMKTVVMFIAALLDQFPDMDNFRDHWVIAALGDDNVSAPVAGTKYIPDMTKFNDFYTASGMSVSSDDKSGAVDFCHRSSVRFLKRETRFHPELGRRVGCLDKMSIFRPFALTRKTNDWNQSMIELVGSCRRECVLWGREFDTMVVAAHKEVFSDNTWVPPPSLLASYDDYVEMMALRDGERSKRVWHGEDAIAVPVDGAAPRFKLKGQDGEAVPVEEDGIREIVEEEAPAQTQEEGSPPQPDPTLARDLPDTMEVPQYLQREVFLFRTNLTRDTVVAAQFNPLLDILDTKGFKDRLNTYHALRADIVVRFAVSGTKFDYGYFMATYMYNPEVLDFQNELSLPHGAQVMIQSQRPHVKFSVGQDETAELRIPFFYHHAMIPNLKEVVAKYVQVRVVSITPPRSGIEDAPVPPSMSVYARLTNMSVMGHSLIQFEDVLTPQEPPPKPSVLLGRVARTAAAAGAIFPSLQPFSSAISAASGGLGTIARAFGYSNPVEVGGSAYINYATAPLANANIDQTGRVLSYDVHQAVSVFPAVGGHTHSDELVISDLVRKPAIIRTGQLGPAVGPGTAVFVCNVTPAVAIGFARPDSAGTMFGLPPCGLVASHFAAWHGTMCYRIDFATTGLVGGKVMVSYNAAGRDVSSDTHTLRNMVVDLKASHSIIVRVNWYSERNWLATFTNSTYSDPFSASYVRGAHNGSWSLQVVQPLVGNKPDQVTDYFVSCWLENERFGDDNYSVMSRHKILRLPNIPTGDSMDPDVVGDPEGPGGELQNPSSTLIDRIIDADIFDGVSGAIIRSRPIGGIVGVFGRPLQRRIRRFRKRGGSGIGESQLKALDPPPTAPTQGPTFGPQPTSAPFASPTRAPSAAPIVVTQTPTRVASLAPSVTATSAPTNAGDCTPYVSAVNPELLGAPKLHFDGVNWVTTEAELAMGTIGFGDAVDPAYVEFTTSERAVSFDLIVSEVSAVAPYRYRLTGNNPGLFSINGSITFAGPGVIVTDVTMTLPGGVYMREYSPAIISALTGWSTGVDDFNGVPVQYVLMPAGQFFTPPETRTVPGCIDPNRHFGCVSYSGRLFHSSKPSTSLTGAGSRIFFGPDLDIEAQLDTKIYAVYVPRPTSEAQDGEVTASTSVVTFEVGNDVPIHDDIVALQMGEDHVSLRPHLMVFREQSKFLVDPGDSVAFQAKLHASGSGLLGPFEILTASFAAVRGGMVAKYALEGDGFAQVQRGRKIFTQQGEFDDDMLHGYEIVDTRVNPYLVVAFPWKSTSRFDYARWSFAGSDPSYRNVQAYNRGDTQLEVTESLRIKDDFSLVNFLGCPFLFSG